MDQDTAAPSLVSAQTSNREIELKLRMRPDALARLRNAPILAGAVGNAGTRRRLEAAYYDTEDFRLRRQKSSFRVRQEGDRFIQTLKAPSSTGGALDRHEWSNQVPSMEAHPDWVIEPDARARLGYFKPGELVEAFRTEIDRETCVLNFADERGGDAVIELAFDLGRIVTPSRVMPLAEVELELLKGKPAQLFALARRLLDTAPFQVETRSKAARAYTLVANERPKWSKAEKLSFGKSTSVDGAIASVFRGCYTHWLDNEAAALDGTDPEGVHQMRVALRRLRSATAIFADVIPDDQRTWLRGESKWLADALGAARNWDVHIADMIDPLVKARADDDGLALLRRQCEGARLDGYRDLREVLASRRYTEFVLRFGEWLESAAWRSGGDPERIALLAQPLRLLADGLLTRQHRKVLKRGRGLKHAAPEDRHELRLAVKKFRYSVEFFASVYGSRKTRAYHSRLTALQDTLGDLNDVTETETRMNSLDASVVPPQDRDAFIRATGIVIGWSAEKARNAEPVLVGQWKAFRKQKPFWTPVARWTGPHAGEDELQRAAGDVAKEPRPASTSRLTVSGSQDTDLSPAPAVPSPSAVVLQIPAGENTPRRRARPRGADTPED